MIAEIRVYLLDDHMLFREGLRRLLLSDARFEVVGQTGDPAEALRALRETVCDVLILDYDLGEMHAPRFLTQLQASGFAGKTLLVTAGLPDRDALALVQSGVAGIFHKQDSPEDLQRAVVDVMQGKALINQRYLQTILTAAQPVDSVSFTERERQTIRGLLQGLANKQIAAQLDVSESSVKATLQGLFSKMGVRTRAQLVLMAIEKYRDKI